MSERTYIENPMYMDTSPDDCNMVLVENSADNCIGCPSLTRVAASVVEIRTNIEHIMREKVLANHISLRGDICEGYQLDSSECTLDTQLQQPRESLAKRVGEQVLRALGAMSPVFIPPQKNKPHD